jgi:hypothetical protein
MTRLWIAIAAVAACAAPPRVPGGRFVNAPPAAVVNDRRDVPAKPDERVFLEMVYHYSAVVNDPVGRAFDLPRPRRALGVNALDEVPDSTWFTNRIGVRDMSIAELVRGPETIESPEHHKPWKIKSTKIGGAQVGFIFEDARGEKFLLKFDTRGVPEQETATNVIIGKLFWACGFNVPQDFVVNMHRDELELAPDATITDELGKKSPLTREEMLRRLERVEVGADGAIRGYASLWLPGKPLGGHPARGVRDDDPNDRIPHELRRDLRGAYAMFSWLDHTDVQESNFIDMWVEDPADPGRHYVKHYLLDFGKSLGVMANTGRNRRLGHAHVFDIRDMGRSLFTAGLVRRSWEGRPNPGLRGIGYYDVASYDPGAWKAASPAYLPFLTADRIDKFWGAKILMRFTRDQLRAIVDTGRFTDPRAAAYLTDTLVARQRATGAYWFARVNPLDRFAIAGDELCFDDLAIRYRFTSADATGYRATRLDRAERTLGTVDARPDRRGHACVPAELTAGGDGYTIFRLDTTRPGFTGTTFVHLARDPASGAPRVIGIWRA